MASRNEFYCSVCGASAGKIELSCTDKGAAVVRESFTSKMTSGVGLERMEEAVVAVETGDVRTLWQIDYELTPFYCPKCDKCYCKDHWDITHLFDGMFDDEIRGSCPEGHERRLED